MVREPWDRKIDEWLDTALSEYGRAEPRAGMEARILEKLRSRPTGVRLVVHLAIQGLDSRPRLPSCDRHDHSRQ